MQRVSDARIRGPDFISRHGEVLRAFKYCFRE